MIITHSANNKLRFQPINYKTLLFAVGIHVALVIGCVYFYQTQKPPILLPDLAVMMQLSENVQAINKEEQVVGIDQQIAVESQKKAEETPTEKLLHLDTNENADIVVEKPKKIANVAQTEKVVPKITPTKPVLEMSENVSSLSAPSTSHSVAKQQSTEISADYDSDSETEANELALWQAKAKGHLNRYKVYPDEAKSKGKTGIPKVRFVVDEQGYVLSSELLVSSGVRSLDKEAQRVLKRAQPLPIPPETLLFKGKITVEMSIEFSTLTR